MRSRLHLWKTQLSAWLILWRRVSRPPPTLNSLVLALTSLGLALLRNAVSGEKPGKLMTFYAILMFWLCGLTVWRLMQAFPEMMKTLEHPDRIINAVSLRVGADLLWLSCVVFGLADVSVRWPNLL